MLKKIILTIMLLALVSCTQEDVIKIGFIGPLTGDLASLGQGTRNAVELAFEEINAKGGINGKQVKVIYEDGGCVGVNANTAANKLVNVDKVQVIIGGVCSPETIAAAPVAEAGKTVLISACSSNPAITDAGDYIFRTYPSDSFQGKVAAEMTFNDFKAKKVALFNCLNDWCVSLKDVFKKTFLGLGGEIVAEEEFEPTARDLRTQLAKVKESDADLIYFLGFTEASIVGLKQAKQIGINTPIFGGDAWDDPKIWESTVGVSDGVSYITGASPMTERFKEDIIKKIGSPDIPVCTPQAYDTAHLIADIISIVGNDGTAIKEALYEVKNYEGITGKITFDENGDPLSAEYVLKVVENGKAKEI